MIMMLLVVLAAILVIASGFWVAVALVRVVSSDEHSKPLADDRQTCGNADQASL